MNFEFLYRCEGDYRLRYVDPFDEWVGNGDKLSLEKEMRSKKDGWQ